MFHRLEPFLIEAFKDELSKRLDCPLKVAIAEIEDMVPAIIQQCKSRMCGSTETSPNGPLLQSSLTQRARPFQSVARANPHTSASHPDNDTLLSTSASFSLQAAASSVSTLSAYGTGNSGQLSNEAGDSESNRYTKSAVTEPHEIDEVDRITGNEQNEQWYSSKSFETHASSSQSLREKGKEKQQALLENLFSSRSRADTVTLSDVNDPDNKTSSICHPVCHSQRAGNQESYHHHPQEEATVPIRTSSWNDPMISATPWTLNPTSTSPKLPDNTLFWSNVAEKELFADFDAQEWFHNIYTS